MCFVNLSLIIISVCSCSLLHERSRPERAPAVCWLQMLSFVISTVFSLAQCPSLFKSGWTWLRLCAALRRKTFAPASVCAGFRGEKNHQEANVKSFAKVRSVLSGHAEAVVPVEAAYLPLLDMWEQRWVTQVRPANAEDWFGLHPVKHHLEPSAAVSSLII